LASRAKIVIIDKKYFRKKRLLSMTKAG